MLQRETMGEDILWLGFLPSYMRSGDRHNGQPHGCHVQRRALPANSSSEGMMGGWGKDRLESGEIAPLQSVLAILPLEVSSRLSQMMS